MSEKQKNGGVEIDLSIPLHELRSYLSWTDAELGRLLLLREPTTDKTFIGMRCQIGSPYGKPINCMLRLAPNNVGLIYQYKTFQRETPTIDVTERCTVCCEVPGPTNDSQWEFGMLYSLGDTIFIGSSSDPNNPKATLYACVSGKDAHARPGLIEQDITERALRLGAAGFRISSIDRQIGQLSSEH